ncbi:MAG: hypothetical protein IKO26_11425 [Paludibacteraceae bacterium]|nr:hypothetical protein [Paludibacteraceae bacterium]
MEKNIYQQPSVTVADITMVQTLCASGGAPTPGTVSGADKLNAVPTDEQW